MRILAISVVSLCLVTPLTAQNTAIAFDSPNHIVATIDLASGTLEKKVTMPIPAAGIVVISPDTQSLLILKGSGFTITKSGDLRPDTKGEWALLAGDKVIGNGELGWFLRSGAFAPDGKYAYVLTGGDDTKNASDLKPAELIRIDAIKGTETGRLSFDRSAAALLFNRSRSTAHIFSPAQSKRSPQLPAQLISVDLETWKQIAAIDIAGNPGSPAAAGDLFYIIDPGDKKSPGTVHVVDLESRRITKSIEVGSGAIRGGSDREGNFFVLSQSPDGKRGQVTIIHGSEVTATYPTGAAPQTATLSADGKRLYVVGNQLNVVDLAAKTSTPGIDAARPTIGLLATRDGRRVVTVAMQDQGCCRISVFDSAADKQLTSFLGGSKGTRVGQRLAAAALSVGSYAAARSATGPGGTFMYSVYAPTVHGAARGPVTFGPGEKKAYAVDTQTSDVTVVDLESGQRIVNIPGGSGLSEVIPLPDAGLIAAVSNERIDLIDTTTDTVREAIPMKSSFNMAYVSPDEKRLVILGTDRILIIDTQTGKPLGMITDLKSPTRVIFLR
jgi:DNA-binding beta-propeller fold protein YncE